MALPTLYLLSLSLISLLFFIPFFILRRAKRPNLNPNPNSPPPSPPKLPIIGNLHQLGSMPPHSLRSLSQIHGSLMILHLGQVQTLVLSSPDAVRDVMKDHSLIFANRPPLKVAHTLLYGSTDMAFSAYGDYWRNARKLCVSHLLSTKLVQSFSHVREEEVALMVDTITSMVSKNGVVNMSEVLNTFLNDILCRILVSEKMSSGGGNERLRTLIGETPTLLGAFNVGDYFPCMGWLDVFFGVNAKAKRCSKVWDEVLDEMIERHQEGREGRENGGDFLDVLLSLQKDPNKDFHLSLENIKALLVDMFVAGIEPPYLVLEWAMAELVRNPEVMKNLQDEVRGIVSGKGKVREEDLIEMSYLKGVLKEALRLHPPTPLLIPRASMEDCQIQGYTIHNKTRVIINAWGIGRDPKYWEAPEEFRPERFVGSPIDYKGNDFKFVPFGIGRRICPGMNFGMAIAELALANLVNQFEWELPEGMTIENFDMTETFGLTSPRKEKLDLLVKPYSF